MAINTICDGYAGFAHRTDANLAWIVTRHNKLMKPTAESLSIECSKLPVAAHQPLEVLNF